jgi:hypothetical protein
VVGGGGVVLNVSVIGFLPLLMADANGLPFSPLPRHFSESGDVGVMNDEDDDDKGDNERLDNDDQAMTECDVDGRNNNIGIIFIMIGDLSSRPRGSVVVAFFTVVVICQIRCLKGFCQQKLLGICQSIFEMGFDKLTPSTCHILSQGHLWIHCLLTQNNRIGQMIQ